MSLGDLVPLLQSLPRAEKLQAIHLLILDLAREEGVPLIQPDAAYPIWSPYQAHDAAEVLLKTLGE